MPWPGCERLTGRWCSALSFGSANFHHVQQKDWLASLTADKSQEVGVFMENIHFFPGLSGVLFHLHYHGLLLRVSSPIFPPPPLSHLSLLSKIPQAKFGLRLGILWIWTYVFIFLILDYKLIQHYQYRHTIFRNELLLAKYFQNIVQYLINPS